MHLDPSYWVIAGLLAGADAGLLYFLYKFNNNLKQSQHEKANHHFTPIDLSDYPNRNRDYRGIPVKFFTDSGREPKD